MSDHAGDPTPPPAEREAPYEPGAVGASALDLVAALLQRVADDESSLQRVAFASTMSHGEAAWVSEVAWQAHLLRMDVAREVKIGGVPRVDLAVNGTAVEFKATFGSWALAGSATAERSQWLGADVAKLRSASVPAVVLVSVAALGPGITHQHRRFKVESDHPRQDGRSPQTVLELGLRAVSATLTDAGCLHIRALQLPTSTINAGEVLLGVVLAAANAAAAAEDAHPQPAH